MFTTHNTEGFTTAELRVLNEVAERLLAEDTDAETSDEDRALIEKFVVDEINNAWVTGLDVDALLAAVRQMRALSRTVLARLGARGGRKGGRSTSPAKRRAAAENGKRGGRPPRGER